MAATANRSTPCRHPEAGMRRVRYPVKANAVIFKGTIVMLLAGYLTPGADTTGGLCVGVAQENVTGGASDGLTFCMVDCGAAWRFVGTGIVAADVGKTAFVSDDITVTDAAGNGVVCGFIEELESANVVWVYIAPSLVGATGPAGAPG